MESFSVIFYETPNGEQPAKLFLNELSEKQRAKTSRDLKLLETCGNKLREPTSKLIIFYYKLLRFRPTHFFAT